MRILHILNDSVPLVSGYAARSKCIVKYQQRARFEPFVVTSLRQGPTLYTTEEIEGITYFRTNPTPGSLLDRRLQLLLGAELGFFYRSILRSVRRVNPSIIHAHSPILCAIPAWLASKKTSLPFIYEIRAFWEDAAVASYKITEESIRYKVIRLLETIVCRLADSVVTISEGMRRDLLERGLPPSKVFVVPNGVDTERYHWASRDTDLVSILNLDEKLVFGYVGQFYDFEGVDDLVRAFGTLSQEESNAVLLLVGGGEKETQIRALTKQINKKNIIMTGKVSYDMAERYYSLIDVLVYPRKSTRLTELTTPLKPLEAMAMGKPIIASAVGGLIELIGEQSGLFYPPGDQNCLLICCKRLLRERNLRVLLGTNGQRRAFEQRNWAMIVKKYGPIYQEAIDKYYSFSEK